jgi:hypothetical protein
MRETAGRLAAARIPEGLARPGCAICERLARIDLSGAWRVDGDTILHFPGRRPGRVIAAPADHYRAGSPGLQGPGRATVSAFLAGYAGDLAADCGLGSHDLVISEKGGHPYAEIVPRRHGGAWGWLRWLNLGTARRGKTCWGLEPGSTANGIANLAWFTLLAGAVITCILGGCGLLP